MSEMSLITRDIIRERERHHCMTEPLLVAYVKGQLMIEKPAVRMFSNHLFKTLDHKGNFNNKVTYQCLTTADEKFSLIGTKHTQITEYSKFHSQFYCR